jgi:hypothetical protein
MPGCSLPLTIKSLLTGEQLTELEALSKTSERQALGVGAGLIDVLVSMVASSFRSDAWSSLLGALSSDEIPSPDPPPGTVQLCIFMC